jgi:hypothetical protein
MGPRRLFLALLIGLLVARPAAATWSIVVVDRRTGEVAVGGATCIPRINLLAGLTTMVPGVGGGVIQASGDSADLVPMAEGFRMGLSPAEILALVQAAEPSVRQLQTGIVSLYPGAPVTFTGSAVGRAKLGVVGEVGDLAYAIQGNVLAGTSVVTAAETALLTTSGDLGQKLLAAMVAARDLGGDGRCSCDFSRPDRCGTPPANFEKSAHVGFLLVARMGDDVPPCQLPDGFDCAAGRMHLRLNIRGMEAAENDPDPVDQLEAAYATWRAERSGRADGLLSRVEAVDSLPADGVTKSAVTVQLVDVDGVPLTQGGARVSVETVGGARSFAAVGPVIDLGDGRYRFFLTASRNPGVDRFQIRVEDDVVRATLFPFLEVRSVPPSPLHVGIDDLSASAGGAAPFVLARPDFAGATYVILASASGTTPPVRLPPVGPVPLVRDAWFDLSLARAGDPQVLPGTFGVLDAEGRAQAALVAPPRALLALVGRRLSWAALLDTAGRYAVTDPVSFTVSP